MREAAPTTKKETPDVQTKSTTSLGMGRMTLQERLAASVAKSRAASPKTVADETSAAATPARSSSDTSRLESNDNAKTNGRASPVRSETPQLPASPVSKEAPILPETTGIQSQNETPDIPVILEDDAHRPQTPIEEPKPSVETSREIDSTDSLLRPSSARISSTSLATDTDPATAELITQLRADLEICETRRIEESQQASERIASLEQKLRLLEEITTERSKEITTDTSADTLEKKLADREEKIVLLLDEGTLSY